MALQREVAPRKAPTQARAQQTVEAILQAATKILVRQGYDGLTTNRVAEKAGVSIGSLYQYFPNKEALVMALVERHVEEHEGLMARMLADLAGAPVHEAVRAYVKAMIAAHAMEPELHVVLIQQLPRIRGFDRVLALFDNSKQMVRTFLEFHAADIRPTDMDMAAHLLVHAVDGCVMAAVVQRRELLRDPAFVEEVTQLVLGYLHIDGAKRPSTAS